MTLDTVFSELQVNGVTLKNRIARSAHGTRLAEGVVTDDLIAYHAARAAGGVGLTVIEIATVHWSSFGKLRNWTDDIIPGYQRLADACHAHGMKLFQQLWHGGAHSPTDDGSPPWSASPIPSVSQAVLPLEMTLDQIAEITEAFAQAARRVKEGGLDGIEVHGAHGYLLGQFLSPLTNRRRDDYGGTFTGRARFLTEVLRAIRDEVGPDFPVGVRLSSTESVPGGIEPSDTADLVRMLDGSGLIDFLDVSIAGYLKHELMIGGTDQPHGYELPDAAPVVAATQVPRMVTGRIKTLAEAEAILQDGTADIVSMVRASIADPDIVTKTQQGRLSEVRPCIGCNQGCVGGLRLAVPRIGCVVNPSAGRELARAELPDRADSRSRVVVVGGGPAGLAAAREAALRGHQVSLYEATDRLGGQLRYAASGPGRSELSEISDWYVDEMDRLGVEIRLSTEVTPVALAALDADQLILASGSTPRRDGLQVARPDIDLSKAPPDKVYTSWDVLGEDALWLDRALVLDDLGHYEAIAVAEALLRRGGSVRMVTRFGSFGQIAAPGAADAARDRLAGQDFQLQAYSTLESFDGSTAIIGSLHSHSQTEVDVDGVVAVCGGLPNDELVSAARSLGLSHVAIVGDALAPRYLQVAITEGAREGRAC